jgi:CheY-like chemotaxis protein
MQHLAFGKVHRVCGYRRLYFPVSSCIMVDSVVGHERNSTTGITKAQEDQDLEAQRILVVDDNEHMREATCDILELEGYTVLAATDGRQALHLIQQSPPDLILTDILMPGMDGYSLCEAVRSEPGGVTIPFIFVTAQPEQSDLLKGKVLAAEDCLTKPFTAEELALAIRTRLGMPPGSATSLQA